MRKPFDIVLMLLDFIISFGALIVAYLIGLVATQALNCEDVFKHQLIHFIIPLWTIVFYLIRKRFNLKITIVQIVLTIVILYLVCLLVNLEPLVFGGMINKHLLFLIFVSTSFALFVLIKHITDSYIVKHYKPVNKI